MARRYHHLLWLGVLALSGCALMQSTAIGTARLRSPGQFSLPGGPGAHHVAIVYRMPGGYDEYHRRQNRGAITEAMYLEANGIQTALDFSIYRLHSWTENYWRFNGAPARLTWHHTQLASVRGGPAHAKTVFARFTRHTPDETRDCVAFTRAWAIPPDDPRMRPSRAYFGYHCAPAGQRLSLAAARRYVVHIRTAKHKLAPVRFGDHVPDEPAALASAHGSTHDYGAPGFPIRRVVDYVVSGNRTD